MAFEYVGVYSADQCSPFGVGDHLGLMMRAQRERGVGHPLVTAGLHQHGSSRDDKQCPPARGRADNGHAGAVSHKYQAYGADVEPVDCSVNVSSAVRDQQVFLGGQAVD